MPLHVVLTGAGGFVGGYAARRLAQRGFTVTAFTRQQPTRAEEQVPGLTWHQGDLREAGMMPSQFDALLHCAAEIPARCADAQELYERNIVPSRNVFEAARRAGALTVVFLSSMSVYGTVREPVVTESTTSRDPDPYGRAKRDAEDLLAASVAAGLPSALAIRLPGVVGRGSHHNFLSDSLRRILAGESIRANHPEALFNNIVYVGHLTTFFEDWMKQPRPGYCVTNLAAGEPLRIREVLALLFAGTGHPEKITFSDEGKMPFLIDLRRALELGYQPGSVRDSIAAFVADCMKSGDGETPYTTSQRGSRQRVDRA